MVIMQNSRRVNKGITMGHSQAEKGRNRERILDEAAKQIRETGLEALSGAPDEEREKGKRKRNEAQQQAFPHE